MAYYKNGSLVTQGDGELATISSCVRLVSEVAPFIHDDPDKIEALRSYSVRLAGSLAVTFMLTPLDPIDSAPADRDFSGDENLGQLQEAIPEFGRVEHQFDGPAAEFMVGALEFRVATAPCDEAEERDYAMATLILEQL